MAFISLSSSIRSGGGLKSHSLRVNASRVQQKTGFNASAACTTMFPPCCGQSANLNASAAGRRPDKDERARRETVDLLDCR